MYHGPALNWATVVINIVASFFVGVLLVFSASWMTDQTRTIIAVGFLGGFSTFSTFSAQAWVDIEGGEPLRALIYVMVSVGFGIAAAAAGYYFARAIA